MERRPWQRAAAWLIILGPFFFASYGFANWLASRRAHVGAVVFGWEHAIPFLAWTIIPYWSIDLLYCISLFVCTTKSELDRHAQRLLLVQLITIPFFIAFPLRFSFAKPPVHGVSGALFAALGSFDKPFNQAPSLHIALLVVIWVCLSRHVVKRWRWLLHAWMTLIGVSILTTYQHHFIDLPTGLAVGFATLWLLPDDGSLMTNLAWTAVAKRRRMAAIYFFDAILFAAMAWFGGAWLWLLWVSAAFLVVAFNYAFAGAAGFQKSRDGRLSAGATGLLAPYIAGAWINSRLWTRRLPAAAEVTDDVWIGRNPSARDLERGQFAAVVDLAAELPCGRLADRFYRAIPLLDMVAPAAEDLKIAANAIEEARTHGRVLVCCALGFSRSAAAIIAWLLTTHRAASLEEAKEIVRKARPAMVISSDKNAVLEAIG
jgi:protein-tyrosine phosphatase